jgi:hypothetical protein
MFHYVGAMNLVEAEEAYRRSVRNLSSSDVADIEANPGKLDDVSPLFRYARRLRRRIHELRDGVIYAEAKGDMLHHPV